MAQGMAEHDSLWSSHKYLALEVNDHMMGKGKDASGMEKDQEYQGGPRRQE